MLLEVLISHQNISAGQLRDSRPEDEALVLSCPLTPPSLCPMKREKTENRLLSFGLLGPITSIVCVLVPPLAQVVSCNGRPQFPSSFQVSDSLSLLMGNHQPGTPLSSTLCRAGQAQLPRNQACIHTSPSS